MAVCYYVGSRTAVKHFVSLNPGQSESTHILRWVTGTRVNPAEVALDKGIC
ncbi:UNVERIFIED_CONTAM: hypothetical protein FKN15_047852 [Acipenser sinensis]